ncbi:MAG: ClbS/DfsB family four-helix bundle protein [Anaerolineales bacterium]|nr:ClbS/DfsB family four-helix bundle protein [Anaerolineales bacterium]
MPRPHTKTHLLAESEKEHNALEDTLSTLTPEQITQTGVVGEWSVKDVLTHLYAWEQMVLSWLAASQNGETPYVPAEGYKWSQLPALNEHIRVTHAGHSLDEVQTMFQASYQQTTERIAPLSEEMLFTPGLYPWMNKNTFAAYFTSCTSSHYRWARKEIRKGVRALGNS